MQINIDGEAIIKVKIRDSDAVEKKDLKTAAAKISWNFQEYKPHSSSLLASQQGKGMQFYPKWTSPSIFQPENFVEFSE